MMPEPAVPIMQRLHSAPHEAVLLLRLPQRVCSVSILLSLHLVQLLHQLLHPVCKVSVTGGQVAARVRGCQLHSPVQIAHLEQRNLSLR